MSRPNKYRRTVLELLAEHGPMTAQEMERRAGDARVKYQVGPMKGAGLLGCTTAALYVWHLTPAGIDELDRIETSETTKQAQSSARRKQA